MIRSKTRSIAAKFDQNRGDGPTHLVRSTPQPSPRRASPAYPQLDRFPCTQRTPPKCTFSSCRSTKPTGVGFL